MADEIVKDESTQSTSTSTTDINSVSSYVKDTNTVQAIKDMYASQLDSTTTNLKKPIISL